MRCRRCASAFAYLTRTEDTVVTERPFFLHLPQVLLVEILKSFWVSVGDAELCLAGLADERGADGLSSGLVNVNRDLGGSPRRHGGERLVG